jgi:hypothetical protein
MFHVKHPRVEANKILMQTDNMPSAKELGHHVKPCLIRYAAVREPRKIFRVTKKGVNKSKEQEVMRKIIKVTVFL